MAFVGDPIFWKRFSRAVHLDEEAKAAADPKNPHHQNHHHNHSNNWVQAQYRKKRRTIICGFLIFLVMASLVAGIIVVFLWLNAHHWLQPQPKDT